jgi:hypothetical protein
LRASEWRRKKAKRSGVQNECERCHQRKQCTVEGEHDKASSVWRRLFDVVDDEILNGAMMAWLPQRREHIAKLPMGQVEEAKPRSGMVLSLLRRFVQN